jgi:HPt (histidine-containing phosphotransfer) domain-containing protein
MTTLNRERLDAFYLDTVCELISKLAYSIESNGESARLAHEIKGLGFMTGAEEIAELSARIEQCANDGRTDETRALVPSLRQAEQRLIAAVASV